MVVFKIFSKKWIFKNFTWFLRIFGHTSVTWDEKLRPFGRNGYFRISLILLQFPDDYKFGTDDAIKNVTYWWRHLINNLVFVILRVKQKRSLTSKISNFRFWRSEKKFFKFISGILCSILNRMSHTKWVIEFGTSFEFGKWSSAFLYWRINEPVWDYKL